MNDLIIFEENGKLLTDSRDVARMIEKRHDHLIRDIRSYCNILTALNFGVSEFFIESSYQDSTGRTLPCYQCTKKGCEMIANKMTGKKGVIFTATYVSAFEKNAGVHQGSKLLCWNTTERASRVTRSCCKYAENE